MRADKERILHYKSFNAAVVLREAFLSYIPELETYFLLCGEIQFVCPLQFKKNGLRE